MSNIDSHPQISPISIGSSSMNKYPSECYLCTTEANFLLTERIISSVIHLCPFIRIMPSLFLHLLLFFYFMSAVWVVCVHLRWGSDLRLVAVIDLDSCMCWDLFTWRWCLFISPGGHTLPLVAGTVSRGHAADVPVTNTRSSSGGAFQLLNEFSHWICKCRNRANVRTILFINICVCVCERESVCSELF